MNSLDSNLPVLVVEPEPASRRALSEMLAGQGQRVDTAADGETAIELIERKSYKLVLAEAAMPRRNGLSLLKEIQRRSSLTPVVLLSGRAEVQEAVEAIRQGAFDYLLKPVSSEIISQILAKLAEMNRGLLKHRTSKSSGEPPARQIITISPEMLRVLEMARSVAPSSATVMIYGESGTGKELLARYIHAHSERSSGPFVAINCAALPENLLESELFGHEKGAFTGAHVRKPGKFELANAGTMLLDEISEMEPALQAKLLRVLQENEVDRVGGRMPVPIDVRVIATTNRHLEKEVEKGRFREDLFFRLNVIPLRLPPLRERPDDILPLARHFIAKSAARNGKPALSLTEEAIAALMSHSWRGNVRELENIIERAVLLCRSDRIGVNDLMLEAKGSLQPTKPAVAIQPGQTIKEMEQHMIQAALSQTRGNRTHAAKVLGISVRTLRNKLKEYRQVSDGLPEQATGRG